MTKNYSLNQRLLAFILLLSLFLQSCGNSFNQFAPKEKEAENESEKQALLEDRILARGGDVDAQFNLGVRYAEGMGVQQDDQIAVEWYQKAAEQGDIGAQYKLGLMYANGRGVTKNPRKAGEWYIKSAIRGDANSQYEIGWMYANGISVEKNEKKAIEWFQRAANHRHEQSVAWLNRLNRIDYSAKQFISTKIIDKSSYVRNKNLKQESQNQEESVDKDNDKEYLQSLHRLVGQEEDSEAKLKAMFQLGELAYNDWQNKPTEIYLLDEAINCLLQAEEDGYLPANQFLEKKKIKKTHPELVEEVKERLVKSGIFKNQKHRIGKLVQVHQPSADILDQIRYNRTFSMVKSSLSDFYSFFNPSHAIEDNKILAGVLEIFDNINNPNSRISKLLEYREIPSVNLPALKRTESETMERVMWASIEQLFPQYFASLGSDSPSDSPMDYIVFSNLLQVFTQGENSLLNHYVNKIKQQIQEEKRDLDSKNALLELLETVAQYLKYLGSEDVKDPLKDPLNKYVKEEVKKAIGLRKWLKESQGHQYYDRFQHQLKQLEGKIRTSRLRVLEEAFIWLFNIYKRIKPEDFTTIQNMHEYIASSEERFAQENYTKFVDFVREYKNIKLYNSFEPNRLRYFGEEIARNQYGTVFYKTICESFQDEYKNSEFHQTVKQIWFLSQLDTVHKQPQEARSRMPVRSIDGQSAPNFGYNMANSESYRVWLEQPLIRAIGDVIVDAFYYTVHFGSNLDINTFLDRLRMNTSNDEMTFENYCINPHPYDRFIIPFELYLLQYIYKQPLISGKGVAVLNEFDQEDLINRSSKVLKRFRDFCEHNLWLVNLEEKRGREGYVLGVGFSGKLFDRINFARENKNKIWLTFSESGRDQGGYLFLELMKEIAQYDANLPKFNPSINLEDLFNKYKVLICQHVNQQIKYYYEKPDYQLNSRMLRYTKRNRNKFEGFMAQLEQGTSFPYLSPEFQQWIIEKNFSNWYCIPVGVEIKIPSEVTDEDKRVHSEARNLAFDAIVGKFTLKDYPYLINELFIHWKDEIWENVDEQVKNKIDSASNLDNVSEILKEQIIGILEKLINQVNPELQAVWEPEIQKMLEKFKNEKQKKIEKEIAKINKSIKTLEGTLEGTSKNRNSRKKTKELTQEEQAKIKDDIKQKLVVAKNKKEACKAKKEQLASYKKLFELPVKYYRGFREYFFEKRNVSQCIEPIFSKVLGHDRFLSIYISNKPETSNKLPILGNCIPQRVIEPCDDRCRFHVLGHLYTGDMLSYQSADQLNNIREIHGLGGVPDRFMTLGHKSFIPIFSQTLYTSCKEKVHNSEFQEQSRVCFSDIKYESIKLAESQGQIGPRRIPGWKLYDVKDEGNCFYEAICHQLEKLNHPFLLEVHETTFPWDLLRLRVQGQDFKDEEWADDKQIDEFIKKFPDIIVAIVDTRNSDNGFICYFYNIDKDEVTTLSPQSIADSLPEGRAIIRLAATGNHFLSVVAHPQLEIGYIRNSFNLPK